MTNTPSNPVATVDVNKTTAQNVELSCDTNVPQLPIGLVPVCALVSQTSGLSGPTAWTVPEGMNFVITDVDVPGNGTLTLPQGFGIEWTPPGGSLRIETWCDSTPGTSQYHYSSGIVVLSGSALTCFQGAVDAALREKNPKAAGGLESYMGVREALAGNLTEARRHAAAMKLGEEPALALALSGDTAQATTVMERLASQTLPGSYDAKMVLPELRGAIELRQGNATRALELFEPLAPYEEGWADRDMAGYLRGEAYLQGHRGQEAAVQFQKILDRPGIVLNSEIGPLARFGLARAYSMLGDKPKARAAYEGFFTLWKDADPDIPVLKEAKAEYAKLQ